MKAGAAKTTKTRSASVTRSFFSPTRSAGFFGAVQRKARPELAVQTKLSVSRLADPLEREADRTAERVMRAPADNVQRAAEAPPQVQRFGEGTPTVPADAHGEIVRATTGGQSLPAGVRSFMEPRLGADLGDVRVHADESAASLSNQLSARAFTYRNHVFFARGQYQPESPGGQQLLAHELTHTIQQGATVQRAAAKPEVQRTAAKPEVQRATAAKPEVQRAPAAGGAPEVQRWGVDSILDYFADKATYIPGFRMLTLVIGFNPINMRSADRTPSNFLRALIELVPGGAVITRVLDAHGIINKAADWVMQKVAALGDIGATIVDAVRRFIAGIAWSDALDPGGVWDRAKRIVTDPIARLISFGGSVVGELLSMVKEAILRPLAALAEGTAGYDLLKAVLGQDPITGDPVPRTADTLLGGFMKLIGQEEIWQNFKKGNAVARAYAWFQGALAGLLGFVRSIPQKIVQTITSLTFEDVITVVGAFRKVGAAFLDVAGRFGSWALDQVLSLLEILFSVVAPGAMPYIAKAKAAFHTIIRDPVRFIGNLVRAGKLGFQNFAANILTHLKTALITWLTGPLGEAGVYIPTSFSLLEIVKLVLSVLGLTWQNIRAKLVRIIPDPILTALEKTAGVLVTLVTQGPAAAWEQIKGELTELKDQLIGQVTQMIQGEIVKAAVTKLVSMINPAGAVVQAIIAVYNTVTFFVEKAQQIGAVVASFIDSISAIAAGQVDGAAKRVEKTMANTLTVVLAFLARFVGLGGVPAKLVGIVKKIRAPIDKALERIVAWLAKFLDKLVGKAKDAAKKLLQWWKKKVPIASGAERHTLTFTGERKGAKLVVMSTPEKPSVFVTREAKDNGMLEEARPYITDTEAKETDIKATQDALAAFDEKAVTAAAGGDANAKAAELDLKLAALGTVITKALALFSKAALVPKFTIERADDFTPAQKRRIAAEYDELRKRLPAGHDYLKSDMVERDAGGKATVRVAPNIDRRHIVSSDDMAKHYASFLEAKTTVEAKLLIEQRSSIAEARVPVTSKKSKKVDGQAIIDAAKRRYRKFFGYAKNIFLGDSSENRSIGKHLDAGHPEMAEAELKNHVSRIKRSWAFGPFNESPVKRS